MHRVKGATLACPICGDHVEVLISADTPVGTISQHECSAGHDFSFRVAVGRLEVLAAPSSPVEYAPLPHGRRHRQAADSLLKP
jgi:hypothetical protein